MSLLRVLALREIQPQDPKPWRGETNGSWVKLCAKQGCVQFMRRLCTIGRKHASIFSRRGIHLCHPRIHVSSRSFRDLEARACRKSTASNKERKSSMSSKEAKKSLAASTTRFSFRSIFRAKSTQLTVLAEMECTRSLPCGLKTS